MQKRLPTSDVRPGTQVLGFADLLLGAAVEGLGGYWYTSLLPTAHLCQLPDLARRFPALDPRLQSPVPSGAEDVGLRPECWGSQIPATSPSQLHPSPPLTQSPAL